MRIQDKLAHNGDHYPTESFKIAYIITRLGGDARGHVSTRRRFTSYESVDDLLDTVNNSVRRHGASPLGLAVAATGQAGFRI